MVLRLQHLGFSGLIVDSVPPAQPAVEEEHVAILPRYPPSPARIR